MNLADRIPATPDPDALLDAFLEHAKEKGLTLYAAQEEAMLELFAGRSVILNTPTGSGKSLVATALAFKAIAEKKRVYYTAPIKALVSEKFFAACRDFGPANVGMMTGDASVNREASVICCTAEILANVALSEQERADLSYVVMDEFHYYADRDRGWAWQVPLLVLPRETRFLLMSATLGDVRKFGDAIEALTGEPPAIVKSEQRPVPLDYTYVETPIHETIQELYDKGRAPIYIVHFAQRAAAEQAQALTSVDFLTKEQKQAIKDATHGFRWDSPFGKDLGRWVRHGIGVHHAGLLPKYRLLVEKLAQDGLLKIICGTDTLGVGVNIPIRTVLFTQLCKYDGKKTAILSVRDFKQIAGRAGRKGYDVEGSVVCQAPEHVIENLKARLRASEDPKKLRKLKSKKPPEFGYAHWDAQTFERLVSGEPERLESSFEVTHGMLLQILDREDGDGCRRVKKVLRASHEPPKRKREHGRAAIAMFRSLLEAGIVEMTKHDGRALVDVNADLQEDFSLHHTLSLYAALAVLELDREDPLYALDVVTIVEATLEDPTQILMKQLDKLKGDRIAELKADGVEYEERMAELDKIDIVKPRLEFILETFEKFREKHPWVGNSSIAPKSIAREMIEKAMGFNEYVKEYGLARGEGLLLRYLSDAYKALVQSVPEGAKTPELYDMTDELGALVRGVDSSLIDEWERMNDPEAIAAKIEKNEDVKPDITKDVKRFTAMVRNAFYRFIGALSRRRWEDAAEYAEGWSMDRLESAMTPYFEEYGELRTDPAARSPRHTLIEAREGEWIARQIMVDAEEHNEWSIEARIDLARAREAGLPVLDVRSIGPS
jgi:superfamily II RNA helicase